MADKKDYTELERNLGEMLRGEDKVGGLSDTAQKVANELETIAISDAGVATNPYDLSSATSTSSINTDAVENAINKAVGSGDDKISITDG